MDNNNSKYTFKTHFITFVSQAITGVLFPYYKEITDNGKFISYSKSYCINQFHDLNIIPVLYVDYINDCWDNYNNRKNEEIEEGLCPLTGLPQCVQCTLLLSCSVLLVIVLVLQCH